MITIDNTTSASDITLESILKVQTKAETLDICKKLGLYVSPNLKKDETAKRVANDMLGNTINILCSLNKQELQIVDEFVKGRADTCVTRKMRKTLYKLQKFCLVVTHENEEKQEWNMFMPDSVRNALSENIRFYLDMAEHDVKAPSPKQLRMMLHKQILLNDGYNQ